MLRLSELYAAERRAAELRDAEQQANKNALLARANKTKTSPRRVRQAVGDKLIEWGTRLQETPQAVPSTNR